MLWHVSVRNCAIMSRSSLCLIDGKTPQGQLKACSLVRSTPQTQFVGRSGGRHPYLRHIASLNAPLCRANPCSAMGRAESQLEAPFSFETSSALCILLGKVLYKSVVRFFSSSLLILQMVDLASFCDSLQVVARISRGLFKNERHNWS